MNQSTMTRILIVDDHPIVRQGLAAIIDMEPDMTVLAQLEDGSEAIEFFRQQQPDVTLMDLRMPQVGGVEAITTICAEYKNARIIVVTTYDGDEEIYRGLQAGAQGYLLKNTKPDELLSAIRIVQTGQQYIPPQVGAKLFERMSNPELSERELEIVRLIATGKTNQEIATTLSVAESTVKFHITRILSKLGASDRTQAVIIALRRGIAKLF
ncbi:MAG: response regulator transcription factor [Rhizonema sp. PD37]|nr:response regulator transcription factor [Rhizonema sp. PD37]